jgi:hypothetical protein
MRTNSATRSSAFSAADLNLPVSSGYTFSNGVYSAAIPFGEADAFVLRGNVSGRQTLTIAFQGTDLSVTQFGQALDWPTFGKYYANFLPLLQVLGAYVQANGIQQIFVTGHSLGGAMVQDFMANVVEGNINGLTANMVSGYTWGSPGADQHPFISRLVNFEDTPDPVPGLGSLLYERSGTDIFINSPILGSRPIMRFL